MDWETWFFEVWEQGENAGTEPTMEDYHDYLFDRADLALGEGIVRIADEPVTVEDRRAMGDDMLYPTHDLFGNWEN